MPVHAKPREIPGPLNTRSCLFGDFSPGEGFVGAGFAGEAEDASADDVAHDF